VSGAIAASRVPYPISDIAGAQHDRCYSPSARDRTGTRAVQKKDLEGVSEATLGTDRSRRLLHRSATARIKPLNI
jgi:hypothetical protein